MLMITENVKGKRYKQLVDILSKNCNRFAFVENRQMMEIEEERLAYIDILIADIAGHLIERKIQREWETTKLSEDTAYVFYFNLNNATRLFLKEHSNSVFDWIGPELPEDLMFYHNDKCLFASCSHERFFMVNETIWDSFLLK
ncbi:stage III sporulation protein AH [Alkalihalobacterium chitinilyticum]|uniref:Stage III sporulation protein AH n=1 Tax=Alkalihalobacterium chitinilyticum TaxID=2980103 RepID=A0ABT5VFN7_9BACI|nr:stage III sporulation protein AH [Alkalihalobacterium chitinilyticum]MDE5414266.1 stage III sporulation protein AH [Alkalihalobacterium chitinilyticum]